MGKKGKKTALFVSICIPIKEADFVKVQSGGRIC
jgi:hypothetical protein